MGSPPVEELAAEVGRIMEARRRGEATISDLTEVGSVADADQFEAAVRDAHSFHDAVAFHALSQSREVWSPHDYEWPIASLLLVELMWRHGYGASCPHVAPGQRRPVLTTAWKPGLFVCEGCAFLLETSGDEDFTCDACHKVVDSATEGISNGFYTERAITFVYGVCRSCAASIRR